MQITFVIMGYVVHEREYGTRVYNEMFTIEDGQGNNFVEVRRNPQSGSSSFTGLSELSLSFATGKPCMLF